MRTQFNEFKNKYFGDSLSIQFKVFNITHLLLFWVFLLCTGLVYIFFPNDRAFIACVVISAFSLFAFYEGNRTGRMIGCAIVMSCAMNFLYFPLIYLCYGEQMCVIPVYFLFGMMYNILMFSNIMAYAVTFIDLCSYIFVLYAGSVYLPDTIRLGRDDLLDYLAMVVALTLVSLVGGIIIKYKLYLFEAEQKIEDEINSKAMDAYVSKDIFLVNMSHEIRTPMNAIMGNVNLLLEQNISDSVRENVYGIANSCRALLALTNEIMDMSKTSSQEMYLYNTRYDIGDLIMEIISMMSVRLIDSDVEFIIEVDNNLPRYLISDYAKIRQVITNILNSAIKYTKKGHIICRIRFEYIEINRINLVVDIEDTGDGIDKDFLQEIFDTNEKFNSDNSDFDDMSDLNLGLVICKEIIKMFDGDLSITSEVGAGTIYSLSIPQNTDGNEQLINIERPDKFHILVYEIDDKKSSQVVRIIENLGIICDVVSRKQDFEDMFLRYHYTHIFIAYDNYLDVEKFLNRRVSDEKIVVIADVAQSVSVIKQGYVISRPICSLSIASVLENKSSRYIREIVSKEALSFPDASIMVVDDNITNLTVANGLLKKYNSNIFTATSGKECLHLLEEHKVDIIFLDYMMPDMDGIDTLNKIRAMNVNDCDKIPVIALTANVVSGAREMFLDAGFSDYIPKPIEIEKIERILKYYLA